MPGRRQRRHFQQIEDFTMGMMIGLRRTGWSLSQIAADTHMDASTVHRLWRTWLEQGNVGRRRSGGAARVTSARVDRRKLWRSRKSLVPRFCSMCKIPWMFPRRREPFPVDCLNVACTHGVR
ncbi:hypothetical protein X975_19325, partial [Stegodyphus mimosarum]